MAHQKHRRELREGNLVEPFSLDAFPGAESFTPYRVLSTHRDHTVDLGIQGRPELGVVAAHVPVARLRPID